MTGTIFEGTHLDDYFRREWRKLEREILQIPNEQLVGLDADQVASEMAAKCAVVCPVLGADISYDDPQLSLNDYDEILKIVQNMVTVFERSRSVFRAMEEEHLRTILFVALNGIFEGGATGETFNGEGKTDILIRVKNSNIFIAECLIWDGPEHFKKKLETQLFRYSTWRDSKLAAVVFNRRKHFSEVVQKMRGVVSALPNRICDMPYSAQSGCRARMRRTDDTQKEFVLTCLAFEVPS